MRLPSRRPAPLRRESGAAGPRHRALGLGCTAALALVATGLPMDAVQADEEPAARTAATGLAATRALDVVVITRSDEGSVFCAIWRDAPGFPVERAKAAYEAVGRPIRNGRTRLHFEAVAAGSAALACFHDENANRTLDTSWIGIPSEGTGASNDARGFMGPPRYEDARFEIAHDDPPQLVIHMQYGLLGGSPGVD